MKSRQVEQLTEQGGMKGRVTGTWFASAGLLAGSLVFSGLAVEVGTRMLESRTIDGQGSLRWRLKPYVLPIREVSRKLEEYEKSPSSFIMYDQDLGWTVRPDAQGENGLYRSNSRGLRADREYSPAKPTGVVRIALFGDSFMFGADVSNRETISHFLEEDLGDSEVLNFGVGGYGLDQAYLRWNAAGREFSPDIVVFGFQAENCKRNLNVFRFTYLPTTGIPFSKPRFELKGQELELVNHPTVPYREIPQVLREFDTSPLSSHEYFYHKEDYSLSSPIHHSRFLSFLEAGLESLGRKAREREFFKEGSQEAELCYRIMRRSVEDAGAQSRVYVLHLPQEMDLLDKSRTGAYLYEGLLQRLKREFSVIDPADDLLGHASAAGIDSLFVGHYSAVANRIIAGRMAEEIRRKPSGNVSP